ncbi:hypothetical protein [Bacillus sp. FJAT-49736]|uniref:hypothetical protein n=1 Tax=Bacillus sp. FJAT-49736 TaxID=2833582 RepID=UPI001BC96738|nr:hypothetical protein [Bacillus sp. FJAT-49736]MBS4175110.1 hypothetical protein [Bacillus sp. FJAT-49736]
MKKYILFLSVFIAGFIALQIISGMVLTIMYTPTWTETSALSSNVVEFGNTSAISSLIIALLALGIAFFSTKLVKKKNS